jgi:hypothetical protein
MFNGGLVLPHAQHLDKARGKQAKRNEADENSEFLRL